MKCADCSRPLLKAALQIESRHGPLSFGPKCARRYIVRRAAGKKTSVRNHRPVAKDSRQLDWVEALAC
jgi:hypothetical protein